MVDDATFLRRAFLDLCGTIPSVSQTRDFLADESINKRERVVDQLLLDRRSPKHLARVWRRMMVPGNGPESTVATQLFEPWLADQFTANLRDHDLARQILLSKKPAEMMQPAGVPGSKNSRAECRRLSSCCRTDCRCGCGASTRFFLGVSLNCAKCHDHPFAKWKQRDFWGMAAFFANPEAMGIANIRSENGRTLPPCFLGRKGRDSRWTERGAEVLVDWMTAPANPYLRDSRQYRVSGCICMDGGAVSEIDDLDRVPVEERSFFLDELGHRFAATNYDLRWLIAGLCKSRTYQRETPGKSSVGQADILTRRPLKTLLPEQVFDAL